MKTIRLNELRVRFLTINVIVTLLALIFLQVLLYLNARTQALPSAIMSRLNILSMIIVTFFVISLFLRVTIKRVANLFEEPEERLFYSKIYTWSLYLFGLFIILYNLGVSLGNITLVIGLIATGLAFAIRDVLLSFFSWMILLRKKPFRIGDYIRIGEDEGRVQHIGTFYVVLDKTPDIPEDYTKIPNRIFMEKSIYNYGKKTVHEQIRFQLHEIPADKDASMDSLKREIKGLVENKEHISLYIDVKDERIYLYITYLINFKNKQAIRSTVIDHAYKRFHASIVVPKP